MSKKSWQWWWLWLILGVPLVVASPPKGKAPLVVSLVERASRSNLEGEEGNGISRGAAVSADGRFVVFSSSSDNLVEGDTNDYGMLGAIGKDIFVYDQQSGLVERVNLSSEGEQGNADSSFPDISADGRFVVFFSYASNLVANDNNGAGDIFVHDRQTGETERVSVSSTGEEQNNTRYGQPQISRDGRFVVFDSYASNLVPNDTNNTADVFIHDRQTGSTERVSLNSEGKQGNSYSYNGVPSDDGQLVAFASNAYNLIANDHNASADVFVHDRQTGITERVSVRSDGTEGIGDSYDPDLSGDGRFVVFDSQADLVATPGPTFRIYLHDRLTHQTIEVSKTGMGIPGNDSSALPRISGDGRFVTFASGANNFVYLDMNQVGDCFVYDTLTGLVFMVSISPSGEQGNDISWNPAISDDGKTVAYWSEATNFAQDTNGLQDVYVSRWWFQQTFLPVLYR